ncbi:RAB7A-interacting MON1-CCZ1 complex subunit 1 isoform X2 [Equus asinus]|uniref:RAB7A interacting MON1-CCZ1 complex subunit 1 n=1 Tax=Equus asinus TaxID=9793 RepID=A0A9L0K6J3_EQUAS
MAAAGSSVVKRVEELGDLAQAHIQQLSEAAGEDDHFLIRASAALEKLKLLCGEDKECSNPSNLLELYTQAILDMTYFEENKLVDEDFPEDSSQKVKELIGFLSEPEILVKENNMHPKHSDLLGDELLECLSWRRGALLYMYCHSLTKRREWLTRKSSFLKKYLVDGISYLLQMLNYRCPIQLNEGVSFQDLDTAKLLSEALEPEPESFRGRHFTEYHVNKTLSCATCISVEEIASILSITRCSWNSFHLTYVSVYRHGKRMFLSAKLFLWCSLLRSFLEHFHLHFTGQN